MNLNTIETAEALENISFVTDPTIVCNYAANMLRQQQALIKQFEETQEYLYKTHDTDKAEIEALKAKLNKYHLKEDLDRNLDLIYGKEFIK